MGLVFIVEIDRPTCIVLYLREDYSLVFLCSKLLLKKYKNEVENQS